MIDDISEKILTLLQQDARLSNAEIARQVGLAPSAVFERIRKLEERGVIRGYEAKLDPHALGLGLVAYIYVRADEPVGSLRAGEALCAIPEVQEVHHIAGEDCYLVKARVADTEALGDLLRERFGAIPSVRTTRSTIVLHTLKETGQLPFPDDATREDRRERPWRERPWRERGETA